MVDIGDYALCELLCGAAFIGIGVSNLCAAPVYPGNRRPLPWSRPLLRGRNRALAAFAAADGL